MGRIELFVTTIMSTPKIRKAHEVVDRALIPYESEIDKFDVASDEGAKAVWKSVAGSNLELPAIFVDGDRKGPIEGLEEAIEYGEVKQFLGLDKEPQKNMEQDLSSLSNAEAEQLAKELGLEDDDPKKASGAGVEESAN